MPKELRVHGVSGTPPAELLYTAPVTYDDSPELAKVFEPNRDTWKVKAYHWGSLTSKSSLTAFWILLAPFAMANVAGWMTEAPNVWSRIWVRVAGLSLTGILFAQAANMTFDIPLSTGMSATAAVWLFYGSSVVLVLGLGLLSTQSTFGALGLAQRLRYLFSPTIGSMNPTYQEPDWTDPAPGAQLDDLPMWGKHSILHRLRRLHLSFAMTVLAVVAARAADAGAIEATAAIVGGVALVLLAFTTGPPATNRLVLGMTAAGPLVAVGVLAWSFWSLAYGNLEPEQINISDDLTFEMALILGLAAGLGLVGEMVKGRITRGWVPMGLLAVAALVGGTFGLTGAMLVESYLTEASDTAQTFSQGAEFVTVAMFGLVLMLALAFTAATFFPTRTEGESRARRAVLRAKFVLAAAGVYGAAIGVLATVMACTGGEGCSQRNIVMPDWITEDPASTTVFLGLPFDPASLVGWAKILMVAVPSVLIVRSIVGGLLNGQDSRRQVGILWDLGSFWPRWFHPLGPPAYGPNAVNRLQSILDEEKPDVLAAHSQGSLISAVAISLVDDDTAPGLFVTYGSQIGFLYPSLFPSVGFDELVSDVSDQVKGRWINLWRPTDTVGGQVIDALGTRNWMVATRGGHSRYELTPEFCAARNVVLTGDLTMPPWEIIERCWDETPPTNVR